MPTQGCTPMLLYCSDVHLSTLTPGFTPYKKQGDQFQHDVCTCRLLGPKETKQRASRQAQVRGKCPRFGTGPFHLRRVPQRTLASRPVSCCVPTRSFTLKQLSRLPVVAAVFSVVVPGPRCHDVWPHVSPPLGPLLCALEVVERHSGVCEISGPVCVFFFRLADVIAGGGHGMVLEVRASHLQVGDNTARKHTEQYEYCRLSDALHTIPCTPPIARTHLLEPTQEATPSQSCVCVCVCVCV